MNRFSLALFFSENEQFLHMAYDHLCNRIAGNGQQHPGNTREFTGGKQEKNDGQRVNVKLPAHNLRGNQLAFKLLDNDDDYNHQHRSRR